jgi:putative intracellular protease/amidase
MQRPNVGILIFDEIEVLDFAGPFEVFSQTRVAPGLASRRTDDGAPFADETARDIAYPRHRP